MTISAAAAAAAQLETSRRWARAASSAAGVPQPLQLLPSLPIAANPAWRSAPSFAAAAALLLPAGSAAGDGATPADVAAAAAVAQQAGAVGRALWALRRRDLFFVGVTPYRHLEGLAHRQDQLLTLTLANLPPEELEDEGEGGGAAGSGGGAALAPARRQQAAALFREVAADQRAGGLRLLGWLLCHLFRWLFNSELYIDAASLQRLRELYERRAEGEGGQAVARGERACLVFVPAHKSHLDYLMLSYILFASGLPCPHIAAGANLRLPVVGRLLRACGAFFIRRTSRGAADSHLYKAVLAAYVHALLQAGHSLEFFIEGGRSRDGRVNPPKLGMLRMVVDAAASEDVKRPVWLVPTAMNYDALLEEGSLAAQLAGAAKKSESLGGLAGTCWGIAAKALRARWQRWALGLGAGGYCGRATVAFGQPVSLQAWLQEHAQQLAAGGHAQRAAVAALGEQLTSSIRAASTLPTSALLLAALFEQQQRQAGRCAGSHGGSIAVSAAEAAAGMDWLADELQRRGALVVRLPRDAADAAGGRQQAQLLHLARMVPRCCGVAAAEQQQPQLYLRQGVQASLMIHARLNQLLPWLSAEGLLVAPLAAAGAAGMTRAALLDAAAWLRCILAPEIDTALGPGSLACLPDFEPALDRLLASGALEQWQHKGGRANSAVLRLAVADSSAARAARLSAALLAPLVASYLHVLRAMQAALEAVGMGGATSKTLCAAAQGRLLALAAAGEAEQAEQAGVGGAAARLVVPSVALVQNALRSFTAVGALVPGPPPQASLCTPNGKAPYAAAASAAAPLSSAAGEMAEGEQPLQVAASGGSGGSGGSAAEGGGVDEEYQVDPPTPQRSPAPSSEPAPGGGEAETQPQRRSFERRRAVRQGLLAAQGQAGEAVEGHALEGQQGQCSGPARSRTPSRSGSDSELEPMAESVAANLCSLDGGSSPQASHATSAVLRSSDAAVVVPVAAAAGHEVHWVLAAGVQAQLVGRLEAALAAFA